MQRSNLPRTVSLFIAGGLWLFLLLSLASFHATDWPSHAVFPHPATRNLCGSAGAFIAVSNATAGPESIAEAARSRRAFGAARGRA